MRNSQSRISCLLSQKYFHLRYFGSTEEASYSFCSHYNKTGQESEQEQTQSSEEFQQYVIPELRKLLSKKGLKILHQKSEAC